MERAGIDQQIAELAQGFASHVISFEVAEPKLQFPNTRLPDLREIMQVLGQGFAQSLCSKTCLPVCRRRRLGPVDVGSGNPAGQAITRWQRQIGRAELRAPGVGIFQVKSMNQKRPSSSCRKGRARSLIHGESRNSGRKPGYHESLTNSFRGMIVGTVASPANF